VAADSGVEDWRLRGEGAAGKEGEIGRGAPVFRFAAETLVQRVRGT
jgi:hypothetical protein